MTALLIFIGLCTWIVLSYKCTVLRRKGEKYLVRWTLLSFFGLFSIKVHKIYISDPAVLHDHPWSYISIILKGGYAETREFKDSSGITFGVSTYYKPGSILFRSGKYPHRIVILDSKVATTIVITGPKFRKWGFVENGVWKDNSELEY